MNPLGSIWVVLTLAAVARGVNRAIVKPALKARLRCRNPLRSTLSLNRMSRSSYSPPFRRYASKSRISLADMLWIKAGGENTMRRRLAEDPAFSALAPRLDDLLDGRHYVGRAPEQVLEFIGSEVDPILERYSDLLGAEGEVTV